MVLPIEQKLTKLRILLRIAEKEETLAYAVAYEKRRAVEALGQEYVETLEQMGRCRWCEQPVALCKGHTLMAEA